MHRQVVASRHDIIALANVHTRRRWFLAQVAWTLRELLGTFVTTFVLALVDASASTAWSILFAMYYSLWAREAPADLFPPVTLARVLVGRHSLARGVFVLVGQLAGGVAGAALVAAVVATPAPVANISRALAVIELVATAVVVAVMLAQQRWRPGVGASEAGAVTAAVQTSCGIAVHSVAPGVATLQLAHVFGAAVVSRRWTAALGWHTLAGVAGAVVAVVLVWCAEAGAFSWFALFNTLVAEAVEMIDDHDVAPTDADALYATLLLADPSLAQDLPRRRVHASHPDARPDAYVSHTDAHAGRRRTDRAVLVVNG